jgi:hypothetical protein
MHGTEHEFLEGVAILDGGRPTAVPSEVPLVAHGRSTSSAVTIPGTGTVLVSVVYPYGPHGPICSI